jgi:hypothetical protein
MLFAAAAAAVEVVREVQLLLASTNSILTRQHADRLQMALCLCL